MGGLRYANVREYWPWFIFMHSPGDPSDPVHIKSIEIYPDPPQPGADMTVKVVGQAEETVEASTGKC